MFIMPHKKYFFIIKNHSDVGDVDLTLNFFGISICYFDIGMFEEPMTGNMTLQSKKMRK